MLMLTIVCCLETIGHCIYTISTVANSDYWPKVMASNSQERFTRGYKLQSNK